MSGDVRPAAIQMRQQISELTVRSCSRAEPARRVRPRSTWFRTHQSPPPSVAPRTQLVYPVIVPSLSNFTLNLLSVLLSALDSKNSRSTPSSTAAVGSTCTVTTNQWQPRPALLSGRLRGPDAASHALDNACDIRRGRRRYCLWTPRLAGGNSVRAGGGGGGAGSPPLPTQGPAEVRLGHTTWSEGTGMVQRWFRSGIRHITYRMQVGGSHFAVMGEQG